MIGQVDSFLLGDGQHLYSYFLRWIWRTNLELFLGGRRSVGLNASWLLNSRSFWTWTFQYYRSQLNFSNFIKPFLTKPKSISNNKKWYSDGSLKGLGQHLGFSSTQKLLAKRYGFRSHHLLRGFWDPKFSHGFVLPGFERVWLLGCLRKIGSMVNNYRL